MNFSRRKLFSVISTGILKYCQMRSSTDSQALLGAVRSIVPPLSYNKYKGQAGRIAVIGGCKEYTGAPYFAAISALKVGCDLSHVFCTGNSASIIKSYSPELIVHPILDNVNAVEEIGEWLSRMHAVVLGPGLGRNENLLPTIKGVVDVVKKKCIPLIVDADGVYFVTSDTSLVKGYSKSILTPNAVEFNRLYESVMKEKVSSDAVEMVDQAVKLSIALEGVTIVRKGPQDIITDGKNVVICDAEGSARRCGGQGDLLSGSMGTFSHWTHTVTNDNDNVLLKQLGPCILAAYAACHLTRRCGCQAFSRHRRATTTTDMIQEVGPAFEHLYSQL